MDEWNLHHFRYRWSRKEEYDWTTCRILWLEVDHRWPGTGRSINTMTLPKCVLHYEACYPCPSHPCFFKMDETKRNGGRGGFSKDLSLKRIAKKKGKNEETIRKIVKDVVTGTDYKVPKRSCVINFEVSSLVGISWPITAANILKAPTSFVSRPPLISYQRKFSFNALIRRHTAALQAEVIALPLEPPARPSFRTPIGVSIRCWYCCDRVERRVTLL